MSDFNRLWRLQRPKGEADAGGHVDLTLDSNWIDLGEHWLRFLSQQSKEFYRAQQVQANTTHVAEVRRNSVTQRINPTMRWFDGERKLQIISVFNVDEKNEVMQMRLVEQV